MNMVKEGNPDLMMLAPTNASPARARTVTRAPTRLRRLAGTGRFATVQRLDMVATVLKNLKENILSGRFGTDGFLPPEGELAQSFGVSRTVIREAMRTLRAYGLVEVSQGRQPRVKPVDPQAAITTLTTLLRRGGASPLDLIEVRRPLESEIAALAAERGTPEHLRKLEATIAEMGRARTLEQQVEGDGKFHRVLAETAGNPVFGLLLDTLSGLMHESRLQTIARTGVERAIAGHRQIFEAVQAHDADAARQAMLEHVRRAEQDLREGKAPSDNGKG